MRKLTWLFGALFLVLTGFGACSATLQWHRAELIDDDPVRVTGVVSRILVEAKGNEEEIAYTVDGQRHTLRKSVDNDSGQPKPGQRVCLEAARTHPEVVRLCAEHYPQGDDIFPVYILVTVFGTAGALFVVGYLVTSARQTGRARRAQESPLEAPA